MATILVFFFDLQDAKMGSVPIKMCAFFIIACAIAKTNVQCEKRLRCKIGTL